MAAVCTDRATAVGRRLKGEGVVETGRGTEEEEGTETEGGIGDLIEEKGEDPAHETDDRGVLIEAFLIFKICFLAMSPLQSPHDEIGGRGEILHESVLLIP